VPTTPARKLQMILHWPMWGSHATLGDVITRPASRKRRPDGTAKKGTVVKGVIVRTRKEQRRAWSTYIRVDTNAAVLINDAASRLERASFFVCGPAKLRDKKFLKLCR